MFKRVILSLFLFYTSLAYSANDFVISDIRIEGLQRIAAGTVFANLPFNIQDEVSTELIREAITVLFRSGNFEDIKIGRDGDVLVIQVKERPSIAEIQIEGNKAIKEEDLLVGLKQSGLAEGLVFKQSTLEGIRQELQRQYVSQGRYDAEVVVEVEALPQNSVALHIDIDEGSVAKIKHLNIVGNQKFDNDTLLDLFELSATGWWSWANSEDKYARERLMGDLETLESFYRDQGYLKFEITSTQVSLSPEKDAVFITINVDEGDVYSVSEVKLAGDIILEESVVKALILLKAGDTYSQRLVTTSEEFISRVLGNNGYTYAKVRHYPTINEDEKTVELTFFVDPGNRTYVNRIEFYGNTTTQDEVLRREMRQMEAAPASGQRIEQSRIRLERLGFFKSVSYELVDVPGTDDQVDVIFNVEEQHSGSIGASIGYADGSGMVFSANLEQNNFMGSGKRVGVGVTKNDYQTRYNFSYTNPYYTIDGVSRGFSLFYKETDFDELGVAEYSSNSYGASLSYGYPISETASIGFGVSYSFIDLEIGPFAPQEVVGSPRTLSNADTYIGLQSGAVGNVEDLLGLGLDPFLSPEPGFVDLHGEEYDNLTLNLSLRQSRLNRGMMPTKGYSQSLSLEVGVPGSDLEYFKVNYQGQYILNLADKLSFEHSDEFALRVHTTLGYGDGYGDTEELPFFEHYYTGGFGSVRGFERSSLGPKGTRAMTYGSGQYVYDEVARKFVAIPLGSSPDSFGGNILVEAGLEFIFPLLFIEDRRSLRTVLFLDSGYVFDSNCGSGQADCYDIDFAEMRASYGIGLTWISALGPLTFSLAQPINESDEDDTKVFQFSIGAGF